jgi:hypothetical protein
MKRIKILLLSVLVLSGIILIFSALIPSKTKVSRTTSVVARRDSIMEQLTNVENWTYWHPQLNSDSARRLVTYTPVRSGAKTWLSYNNFKMELAAVTDSTIDIVMTNVEGQTLPSTIQVIAVKDSCIINWYASFKVKWYPWEKFRSIFFDNMYGPSLEKNLVAFKKYMEARVGRPQ